MEQSIYKQAAAQKLRFDTNKGSLSVEGLFTLSLGELDKLAVELEDEVSKSPRKSFLTDASAADNTAKLRFDIVFDVLSTKKAYADAATKAQETKQAKTRIQELILQKKDESLATKSVDELEALLASL